MQEKPDALECITPTCCRGHMSTTGSRMRLRLLHREEDQDNRWRHRPGTSCPSAPGLFRGILSTQILLLEVFLLIKVQQGSIFISPPSVPLPYFPSPAVSGAGLAVCPSLAPLLRPDKGHAGPQGWNKGRLEVQQKIRTFRESVRSREEFCLSSFQTHLRAEVLNPLLLLCLSSGAVHSNRV